MIMPPAGSTVKKQGSNQRRIQKTRLPGKEGSNVADGKNTLLLKEPVFPLSADEHIMKLSVFISCFALCFRFFVKIIFANILK
jgi:hypothetical protein